MSKPIFPGRAMLLVALFAASVLVLSLAMAGAHQDAAIESAGPVSTASGLIYEELQAGTGASPRSSDTVRVHYHGTLTDGSVFDSSVERGQPIDLSLQRVIACWQEGIPMMKEGGKSRLTCPAAIAYGQRAVGSIPAGSTLIFDVELIQVRR